MATHSSWGRTVSTGAWMEEGAVTHPEVLTGGSRWLVMPQACPFKKTVAGVCGRSTRQVPLKSLRS